MNQHPKILHVKVHIDMRILHLNIQLPCWFWVFDQYKILNI